MFKNFRFVATFHKIKKERENNYDLTPENSGTVDPNTLIDNIMEMEAKSLDIDNARQLMTREQFEKLLDAVKYRPTEYAMAQSQEIRKVQNQSNQQIGE